MQYILKGKFLNPEANAGYPMAWFSKQFLWIAGTLKSDTLEPPNYFAYFHYFSFWFVARLRDSAFKGCPTA